MSPHNPHRPALVLLFALSVAAPGAYAQDAGRADERDARRDEMARVARAIRVTSIDDQRGETPSVPGAEPIHRWTDPTREFSIGSLWVWRSSGRPVAVVGVELYAMWSLEFVSLSSGPVKAEYDGIRWAPMKPGVTFQPVADSPEPATTETGRLRQMLELARRFSAREHWIGGNGQHYALRLLTHPIDRYADPASGVVDGGLFVYANGTNPEALLLIEARRNGNGPPAWSFAAAPISNAAVTLKVGPRDVWTCPDKRAGRSVGPNDPYYDVLVPRLSPDDGQPRRPRAR
jgi:hypothetical protein